MNKIFVQTLVVLMCVQSMPSRAWMSAATLPKGVRTAAYVYAWGNNISSQFNEGGNIESLAEPLNRTLDINFLKKQDSDLAQAHDVINAVHDYGYGDYLLNINMNSEVNVQERRHVFAFLYGLNDNLTMGLVLPYQKRITKVKFSVETENNALEVADKIGNQVPYVYEGLTQELATMNINEEYMINQIFTKNGYKRPGTYEADGLGEIQLESRYRYYSSDYFALGLRAGLVFPTSTYTRDIHNIFDMGLADDTYALKIGSVHEFNPIPKVINLHTALLYTYRLPDTEIMAVPPSQEDPLPNSKDPEQVTRVNRYLGASLDAEAGVSWDIYNGTVSLAATYQYTYKERDRFTGDKNLYYPYWSRTKDSHLHGIEYTAELSSIHLFLKKISPVPAKIWLTYFQPLSGQETTVAPYGTLNFAMLF